MHVDVPAAVRSADPYLPHGLLQSPFGSPLASLTWCANHLSMRGMPLRAGDLVIGGASESAHARRAERLDLNAS